MQLLGQKKITRMQQQKHCPYCGNVLRPELANVDHLIPRGRMKHLHGEARRELQRGNTVVACATCNKHKGLLLPLEFLMGCHQVGGDPPNPTPFRITPFKYGSRIFQWKGEPFKKARSSSG